MATTWMVRTSGANTNGGTSATVRSTGTDGVSNTTAGLTKFSSISATWSSADVGHAIYASGGTITRLISAVRVQQTLASVTTANGSASVSSAGLFASSMVGCAISGPGIAAGACITVLNSASVVTISAAAGAGYGSGSATLGALLTTTGTTNFTTGSGQTWNVGGALLTVNRLLVTASGAINCMAAGDLAYIGAGTYGETTAVGISGASTATGTNGVTSSAGTVFTDNTAAAFTSAMAGRNIEITAGGSTYVCKISAYTSASVVTIAPATATGFPATAFSSCSWIVGKIAIIGDVDGAQTGDAGQVILSAYTSGNTSAPSSTTLLALTTTTYLSFSLFTFVGGSSYSVYCTAAGHDYTFTDCVFNALYLTSALPNLYFISPTNATALNVTLDRCEIASTYRAVEFSLATASGSLDWDAQCIIRNCKIDGSPTIGVYIIATGSAARHGGGVRIYDSTILAATGVTLGTATYLSTSVPCEIHNSLVIASGTGFNVATSGQLTGSYNSIYAATPESNYSYGTGDVSNSSGGTNTFLAPLLELGQSYKWAGVLRQFLAPDTSSPLLGAGSSTFTGNYPTVDWANRPRPSGGQSPNASIGAFEFHDYAIEDTVVYNDSPASGELVGPGDQFIQVPVDGVSSTISIYVRFDSYGGTNYPCVNLLANGELGVAAQTQTCSSSSGTWQQLMFSAVVPSKAGWVTLQVVSYDTGGKGSVHFDTLAVA